MIWYPEPWLMSGLMMIVGIFMVYAVLSTHFMPWHKKLFHAVSRNRIGDFVSGAIGIWLIVRAILLYIANQ